MQQQLQSLPQWQQWQLAGKGLVCVRRKHMGCLSWQVSRRRSRGSTGGTLAFGRACQAAWDVYKQQLASSSLPLPASAS
jgi:hypothetical protein